MAGPAFGLASAGVKAYGDYQAGQAGYQTGMYQAAVAMNNAVIANQMADREGFAGEVASGLESMRGGARVGDEKAAMAANGVDVNSGSAVDVAVSQRMESKLSADTTMNNALLKAYGYRVQAQSDIAQSQLDTMGANNRRAAGRISAFGDLLSGASSFFSGGGGGGGSDASGALPTSDMVAGDTASVEGGALY
jgi:hypothetical protein